MNEQIEMNLNDEEDQAQGEAAIAKLRDDIQTVVENALTSLKELGADALLVMHSEALNSGGVWTSSENEIINMGLARLVEKKV